MPLKPGKVKGGGLATDIAQLIETTENRLPILSGRGGLELIENLRAGLRRHDPGTGGYCDPRSGAGHAAFGEALVQKHVAKLGRFSGAAQDGHGSHLRRS